MVDRVTWLSSSSWKTSSVALVCDGGKEESQIHYQGFIWRGWDPLSQNFEANIISSFSS